jgi:hypothetical protein
LHALYRVGLLGYVQHDLVRGEWRQRFLRPGEATLDPNGTLPHATHYLVHPILSNVIARANPAFLQRIDRVNIVGYDRPWHEPDSNLDRGDSARSCCVLKADVHGFGALMRAGMDAPVRRALEDAVTRWAPATAIVETGAGDSALIADDDPVALAQAARHFMDDVYKAPGQPRLRIALHYGEVKMRQRDTDLRTIIVGGDAILCAARSSRSSSPGRSGRRKRSASSSRSGLRCGARYRCRRPRAATPSTSASRGARSRNSGFACIGWNPDDHDDERRRA